jgi:hypothetical protein
MGSGKTNGFSLTDADRETFLKEDLPDSLKWLVVGAAMWQATESQERKPELVPHQRPVGMFTTFIQARALYEFFYAQKRTDDDARAKDFTDSWKPKNSPTLERYLSKTKPVNKRIFHLVYRRSERAGGNKKNELTHLKNQVIAVTKELLCVAREFEGEVKSEFRADVKTALNDALNEAQERAKQYDIRNPFEEFKTS